MIKLQKTVNTGHEGQKHPSISHIPDVNIKWYNHFCKNHIQLSNDTEILRIHPRERKTCINKNTYIRMVKSSLFIITKPVNNPNIYIKENGLTKLQYIYIMIY